MEDLRAAIEALQRAREAKLAELRSIDRALEALEANAPMEGGSAATQPSSDEFKYLGVTAAAKQYLAQQGGARSTRQIVDALLAGGIQTRSKRFGATVYATLHNSADFRRTPDDKWELAPPVA
jgi:hypothetical protein